MEFPAVIRSMGEIYRLTAAEVRTLHVILDVGRVATASLLLHLSEATVKTHLRHIFQKTGARNQVDLVSLPPASPVPWPRSENRVTAPSAAAAAWPQGAVPSTPRTSIRTGSRMWRGGPLSNSNSAAARPFSSAGSSATVSGGSVRSVRSELSMPMIESCRGTSMPPPLRFVKRAHREFGAGRHDCRDVGCAVEQQCDGALAVKAHFLIGAAAFDDRFAARRHADFGKRVGKSGQPFDVAGIGHREFVWPILCAMEHRRRRQAPA